MNYSVYTQSMALYADPRRWHQRNTDPVIQKNVDSGMCPTTRVIERRNATSADTPREISSAVRRGSLLFFFAILRNREQDTDGPRSVAVEERPRNYDHDAG